MKKGFTVIELVVVVAVLGILTMSIKPLSKGVHVDSPVVATKEQVLPEATGYVVDQANILSSETKQQLEEMLKKADPTAQVAVVTVKTTQPLDEKQYAIKLAEKWKPGHKGKDNGIIFLVVTEDRKLRIEVGRGLESVLNDAKAGRILDDSVVPYLKKGEWDLGIKAGTDAIVKEVNK